MATGMLSAVRVIMRAAFGVWRYDELAGKEAIAVAAKRKPSKAGTARPPVDLVPLFRFMQRKGKGDGDPQRIALQYVRNNPAVTMLVQLAARCADIAHTDLRDPEYFEAVDMNGEPVDLRAGDALVRIVRGRIRYKEPKEGGAFSAWVQWRRISTTALVDDTEPHRQRQDDIRKLDFVFWAVVMFQRCPLLWSAIEPGRTFVDLTQKRIPTDGGARLPGIGATGIIAAVKRMRVDAGVEINEDDHRDTGGHVFRSVASSAIYHVQRAGLVAYGDDEHVHRTRHAKAGIDGADTFTKNYERPIPNRLRAAVERYVCKFGLTAQADEIPFM